VYGGPVRDRTRVWTVEGRAARIMASSAFAIVLLADALYVGLIMGEANRPLDMFTVPFVAGYLVIMAALLGVSLLQRPRIVAARTALRAAAAGGLLVLGIVAAFSIGLPFIVAGALATGATVRTLRGPLVTASSLSAVAAAVVSVVVLVAGFEVTERLIVCPAQGSIGGGGSGFVTGPYYYECVDGRLDFHSGSCSSTSIDSGGNVSHPGC
jgi:hypothetical protein